MFRNNVYTFKNFPVAQQQRKCTDCICVIVSTLFALTLFILSLIMFRRENLSQAFTPAEESGQTCGKDLQQTPYIYFLNPKDMSSDRFCVSKCPGEGEPLQCARQHAGRCIGMGGSRYETEAVTSRFGAFCIATDKTMADEMWGSPELADKTSLLYSFDIVLIDLLIALFIGIVFLAITIKLPRLMVTIGFVVAIILLLVAGILTFLQPIDFIPKIWSIILAIFLLVSALCFLLYFVLFKKELQVCKIFIENWAQILKETPIVFAYIPLFVILTLGLLILITWQYISFASINKPEYQEGALFKSVSHNMALQILNIIELIWGLQFLRDAFNYVVSGNTVEQYCGKDNNESKFTCCLPFTQFLRKNWGSVAGGSFLNAFFTLFDIVSDMLKCDPRGSCSRCSSCHKVCFCCNYIFQLVRTDAYSYIYLSGIPYCQATKTCETLCQYSQAFRGSQSCMRLFRIASHIFQVSIVAIISYFILSARSSYINPYVTILTILGAYSIVVYFIDVVADGAQALMVCYLTEQNLEGEAMDTAPAKLREDMYNHYHQHHR